MSSVEADLAVPIGDRIADSLADLADSLNGFRAWVDKAQAEEEQEKREKADRDARDRPAEWQAALDALHEWLTGYFDENRTAGEPLPGDHAAERLVKAIDQRLRDGYYDLRYAFEALGQHPPEDLRTIAERKAIDAGIEQGSAAWDTFVEAWMAGRTEGLR